MSWPVAICRNKVQAELKAEIESLLDKEFSVVTLLKKKEKKTVATPLTQSRKRSRQTEKELCHDNPSSVAT